MGCCRAAHAKPHRKSRALTGDARQLSRLLRKHDPFTVSIFSPPYPNRYDYTANYQLELGFGFVNSRDRLKTLRRSQLRSHLEAPWPEEQQVCSDALDEFLAALLATRHPGDQVGRVFKMCAGFFEDMRVVLSEMLEVMAPASTVAVVVGTQVYAGQSLPTDLLLAELAASLSFNVKEIWIARTKGVAVQQRTRLGEIASSRESVVILETPATKRMTH